MQETSAYEVYLNIKLVRIFSSGAYLGEFEIEKLTITLKYATDAERLFKKSPRKANSLLFILYVLVVGMVMGACSLGTQQTLTLVVIVKT